MPAIVRRLPVLSALLSVSLLLAVACPRQDPVPTTPPPGARAVVYASFQPLADFARRVGGPAVEVRAVCPPEDDPARCTPKAEIIAAMQEAALVLLNGAAFEKWPETVSLNPTRVVDTSAALSEALLRYEDAAPHQHGADGALHTHEGIDGHTWLDPKRAAEQVRALTRRFQASWPALSADFETRQAALVAELDALDARHRALVAKHGAPALFASHPAYNYLAQRYAWRLVNLDVDPEAPLDPATERTIAERAKTHPAKLILFESEPSPALAEALRERLGLVSVLYSPAETPNPEGDYLAVMRQNLDRLEAALAASAQE